MKNTVGKICSIIMLMIPLCAVAQEKVYKVGDYYNVNGVEGIVFQITEGGRHGKIVSLDNSVGGYNWTTLRDPDRKPYGSFTFGTSDENDGQRNTDIIKNLSTYSSEAFPAFAFCMAKGEGWYLPAINEMREIDNARAQDDLDVSIANAGGMPFKNYYWSSTETDSNKNDAWGIIMGQGTVFGYTKHDGIYGVRPVHKF